MDVDGARLGAWTATPDDLHALAHGRLLADGFIGAATDVLSLEVVMDEPAGTVGLRASVRDPRPGLEFRRHLAAHGCGALGYARCLGRLTARRRELLPDGAVLASLLGELFAREAAARSERGGMHGAGIATAGVLRIAASDVSRHSAVDKAIGRALMESMALGDAGLVTTARISGDMAARAAIADMAFVASRSVPTTLAVEIARAAGLPLVARAGSPDAEVHAS